MNTHDTPDWFHPDHDRHRGSATNDRGRGRKWWVLVALLGVGVGSYFLVSWVRDMLIVAADAQAVHRPVMVRVTPEDQSRRVIFLDRPSVAGNVEGHNLLKGWRVMRGPAAR